MPSIAVTTGGVTASHAFSGEQTVRDILIQTGARLSMPCSGNHTCGKCKVRCDGALSPLTADEAAFLTSQELTEGYRLACFAKARGDFSVFLPDASVSTLSAVTLPRHACTGQGWGLAVDIGTTTVAAQLYRLETGALCGEALGANAQACFGADVISRIEYSNQNGCGQLQRAVRDQVQDMAASCMRQAGAASLDAAVVTGNTTMLHFWEGLDARGIAVAPFTPASLFGTSSACALMGRAPYLPPCLGPYIGADITCAILASEMTARPEETSLLIDLGTNGEIALFRDGTLYCASTAMGPAFEGAGLTFGMQAAPGAVSAVRQSGDGAVSASVLPGRPAAGICGSGILDAVRVLLEQGILDETGLLCDANPSVTVWQDEPAWQVPGTGVFITQKDIRQIQLAKAAICAGIHTLLQTVSLTPEEIDRFYIAGGFGHSMDLASAAAVGLFPPALAPKAKVLGNAALSGAAALLLDDAALSAAREIQSRASEIPLSGNAGFSDFYIDNIMFTLDDQET